MKRGDAAVTLEIRRVEREYGLDSVDSHDGYEPCVIDLDALDAMILHDFFPSGVNCRNIEQYGEQAFNTANLSQDFLMRQSEPVQLSGSCCDVLEFSDVLSTDENSLPIPHKLRDGVSGLRAMWIVRLGAAQQNIRVNEDTHQCSRPSYMDSRLTA